ncbi:hypothetical protein [Rhizocola hellebori]|uniref:hypothetical protein n=1 Tax=Rhizocola hellebori TaxID=1392758 RepID=UPI001941384C|nr:hypothetical protein [Rhizocola hellebori]
MADDGLAEMHRQAEALSHVLQRAGAISVESAEGYDDTGEIRATVGPQGLPESVEVGYQWLRMIGSGAFGQAVTAAFASAAQSWAIAWADELQKSGLLQQLDDPPAASAPMPVDQIPHHVVRDPATVAGELLDALDTVDAATAALAQPVQGIGSAAMGKLTLTVSREGAVACAADAGWVSGQGAGQLTAALRQVLAEALAQLHATTAETDPAAQLRRLDAVQAEAIALLKGETHVG